ncbi:MAG: hypothetical protein ACLR76_12000 [Alistipes sp.]
MAFCRAQVVDGFAPVEASDAATLADATLAVVVDGQIGDARTAAERIFARFSGSVTADPPILRAARRNAATPAFAGIVIGIDRSAGLRLQPPGGDQSFDVIEWCNTSMPGRSAFPEYAQQIGQEVTASMPCLEQLRLLSIMAWRRRSRRMASAAGAATPVRRPADRLAGRLEDTLHRVQNQASAASAAGEIAYVAFALRAVDPLRVAVAVVPDRNRTLLSAVEP